MTIDTSTDTARTTVISQHGLVTIDLSGPGVLAWSVGIERLAAEIPKQPYTLNLPQATTEPLDEDATAVLPMVPARREAIRAELA